MLKGLLNILKVGIENSHGEKIPILFKKGSL